MPTDPLLLVFVQEIGADILANITLKLAASLGVKSTGVINYIREKIPQYASTTFLFNRIDLVNFESEQKGIKAALKLQTTSRLLYFSGQGGIGKTRLLQEAEKLAAKNHNVRWAGLVDLYHSNLHEIFQVISTIINHLDPAQEYFKNTIDALVDLEHEKKAGIVGKFLSTKRELVYENFLCEYETFSHKYRIVLAFDTLETLRSESTFVREICQLDDLADNQSDILRWLLDVGPKLPNTVILLAGRQDEILQDAIKQTFENASVQYHIYNLRSLNNPDREVFFQKLINSKNYPGDVKDVIFDLQDKVLHSSQGIPVRILLCAELLIQGFTHDVILDALEASSGSIELNLINLYFSTLNEQRKILFYLAIARKGLDAQLLSYLEPENDLQYSEKEIEKVESASLVKTRKEESELLFLHDELYALFDENFKNDVNMQHLIQVNQIEIAEYYRARRYKVVQIQERNEAQVNEFYYSLCCDSQFAFDNYYLRWSEDAIKAQDLELDSLLRDELYRFLDSTIYDTQKNTKTILSRSLVEQDSIIRWMKRFIAIGNHDRAINIAQSVMQLSPSTFVEGNTNAALKNFPQNDHFFWGHFLTYYAEALVYKGETGEATNNLLKEAVERIQQAMSTASWPEWLKKRTIGRALNIQAYNLRLKGDYKQAEFYYLKALEYFQKEEDQEADTRNNLAFVLGLLGNLPEANKQINRALDIRQQRQKKHPIGLSINTRGRLNALNHEYELAKRDCLRAYALFEETETWNYIPDGDVKITPRGMGLTCNALGFIFRREAAFLKEQGIEFEQIKSLYEEAESYLEEAEGIFSPQTISEQEGDPPARENLPLVVEPVRAWEALNEMGCLYHDWAMLIKKRDANSPLIKKYFNKSKGKLEQAEKIAQQLAEEQGNHLQLADTIDDLAKLYASQGKLEQAKEKIEELRNIVPAQYFLDAFPGKLLYDPSLAGHAYGLLAGKYYIFHALWAIESSDENDLRVGFDNLIKAFICFLYFTPHKNAWQAQINGPISKLKQNAQLFMMFTVYLQEKMNANGELLAKILQII